MLDERIDYLKEGIRDYSSILNRIKQELSKVVVGQDVIINGLLRGLVADGHVLVEGVPGVAKTLIIKTLAKVVGCKQKRI